MSFYRKYARNDSRFFESIKHSFRVNATGDISGYRLIRWSKG